MHQLQNESLKLLNILFKNLWIVSMFNYNRKIETSGNSLFDDKSIWYSCIQNVVIKFLGAINMNDNLIASLNTREFFDHKHLRIFWSMMSRVYLLHPYPKTALELLSFIYPEYLWAKLYGFCHAFIFMPIWSIFSIQFFDISK